MVWQLPGDSGDFCLVWLPCLPGCSMSEALKGAGVEEKKERRGEGGEEGKGWS